MSNFHSNEIKDIEFLAWIEKQWQTPIVTLVDSVNTNQEKVQRLTFIDGTHRFLKKMASAHRIRLELSIHKVLLEYGVRIAPLLPTYCGERWAEHDGHLYVLAEELAGAVITKVQPRDAFLFGQGLAQLHQAMAVLEDGGQYPRMNLAQQLEEWAFPITMEAIEKDRNRDAIKKLVSEMKVVWFPILELIPKQLIHRDTHPGNMIMGEDGKVGFLDFDISQSGIRLLDICYFCTSQWISDYSLQKYADSWINLLTEFRRGYEEISLLSDLEQASAFFVMCAIQMIFISFWHEKKRPDLVETNLETLIGLLQNRASIKLAFGIGS